MARAGAMTKASTALLLILLVLVNAAATADAVAGNDEMLAAGGRRGGRARPAGLTQCVAGCGTSVTSCLLNCYDASADGARKVLLPVCFFDCTNDAMFCATNCTTQAL